MLQNFFFEPTGRSIQMACSYIRYESEVSGAVNPAVRVRAGGQDLGEWLPGDAMNLPTQVSQVEISPVAGATGVVRLAVGNVTVDRVTLAGNVAATITVNKLPTVPTFSQPLKTVTSASGLLLAANPNRRYLAVQNLNSAGYISLGFDAAAVLGAGLTIAAAGNWEFPVIPLGAIYAIGSIASNPNIVVVEG